MKQENEVRNLNDYFSLIRKRPAMYLGKNEISMLWDHLQGYKMAFWINNIENAIDRDFFDSFNDFVCNYYNVELCCDWKSIILEQSFNKEEFALSKFFDLWDILLEMLLKIFIIQRESLFRCLMSSFSIKRK
jgi:hypothetical protein